MKKRIISLFLVLAVSFSMFCPLAFADDSSTHEHDWSSGIISEFSGTVEGIPVSVSVKKCTKCKFYKHTYKFFGLSFDFYNVTAYTGIVEDFLLDVTLHISSALGQNATAKQFTPGGGSAEGSSGVGRSDLGYTEDNKPLVSHDGTLVVMAEPYGVSGSSSSGFTKTVPTAKLMALASGGTGGGTQYVDSYNVRAVYRFTAPVTGLYYVGSGGSPYSLGFCDFVYGEKWNRVDFTFTYTSTLKYNISLSKGEVAYLYFPQIYNDSSTAAFKFSMKNCPISVDVLSDSNITNYNNYTINKNQWNGNIYVDNSTNLTYIYPQYTTVNENNEYVTNISENPIIYNNTTNQYYTYDTITNNYYYITYVTESPTPTPNPDPTPTPTPGGDTGNTGDSSGILAVLVEIRDNMIQGFADIKATLVQGWADLSANFTLAIENLTINIQNFFQKGLSQR